MYKSMVSFSLFLILLPALGAQAVNQLHLEWNSRFFDVGSDSLNVSLHWQEIKPREGSAAAYVNNINYTVEYSTNADFHNAEILQTKEKTACIKLGRDHNYYIRVRASWNFYRYPHTNIGNWSNAIFINSRDHRDL